MSQIRNYIFVFLIVMSTFSFAQTLNTQDTKALIEMLDEHLKEHKKHIDVRDYYKAKESLTKAKEIAVKLNDPKSEAIIYTKMAKNEYYLNELDKAFEFLDRATEIQRNPEYEIDLALTYNIRGFILSSKNEFDDALQYYNSAIDIFDKLGKEKYKPEVMLNKARVFISQKEYTKAKDQLESTIELAEKHDKKLTQSDALIQNAKVYSKLENNSIAQINANDGLKIAKENNYSRVINDAYFTLSEIYGKSKNLEKELLYYKKYIGMSDSLQNIQRKDFSIEEGIISVQKNSSDEQLKDQIDEAFADSNLARITTILSISLITILSLLTLSLYKNNNIRLRTNNMLHKKNDELIVAKEKAELASKTKANFLSTVTHELRTPLYAVTGLTNMLLDEGPKESQISHLKSLKFSGDYLLTFINDILQINKIEANKVELDPEQFNLKKKIGNVISALNNSALDNGVEIHYDYEKDLPETYIGDQLKISQILINLLGNAIKFTKDGDIWVRVAKVNQNKNDYRLRFQIEDNGIGISQEKQDNMFESFSQGSVQINRKYGGTGLGLSIVKGLIQILKGKISLKSELGKGTTFFFEIPLTYQEPKKAVPKISEQSKNFKELDLSNIKILVVEDNKINQMITKKILNKMGLFCEVVDNGEEAVGKVRNTEYGVVLMDIHMPGISGLEATKRIRVFDKELTIFALTAVTLEDKMHEFDEAGFDDIISKPFKQEDFEKKLYHALAEGEKTTANS